MDQPTTSADVPRFIWTKKDGSNQTIPLIRPVVTIGSRAGMLVQIKANGIDPAHAAAVNSGGAVRIRALGPGGVLVNDHIVRDAILADGDRVRMGPLQLLYRAGAQTSGQVEEGSRGEIEVDGLRRALPEGVVVIGGEGADLVIPGVADAVGLIASSGARHIFRSLDPATPARINGSEAKEKALRPGDTIEVGGLVLAYVLPRTPPIEAAAGPEVVPSTAATGQEQPSGTTSSSTPASKPEPMGGDGAFIIPKLKPVVGRRGRTASPDWAMRKTSRGTPPVEQMEDREQGHAESPAPARGAIKAVLLPIFILAVAMAGAAAAIWFNVRPITTLEISMSYRPIARSADSDSTVYRKSQEAAFWGPEVRNRAIEILHSTNRQVEEGFLGNLRSATESGELIWNEEKENGGLTFAYRFQSVEENDPNRLTAMFKALYEMSSAEAARVEKTLPPPASRPGRLNDLDYLRRRADELKDEVKRAEGDVPAPAHIDRLRKDATAAREAAQSATEARLRTEIELKHLLGPGSGAATGPTTASTRESPAIADKRSELETRMQIESKAREVQAARDGLLAEAIRRGQRVEILTKELAAAEQAIAEEVDLQKRYGPATRAQPFASWRPMPPGPVRTLSSKDPRGMWIAIAVGAIALLHGIWSLSEARRR